MAQESGAEDFVLLRPRQGGGPNISLDRVRSTLQIPPRTTSTSIPTTRRRKSSGSRAFARPGRTGRGNPPDADYVILADPEGNRSASSRDILPLARRPARQKADGRLPLTVASFPPRRPIPGRSPTTFAAARNADLSSNPTISRTVGSRANTESGAAQTLNGESMTSAAAAFAKGTKVFKYSIQGGAMP